MGKNLLHPEVAEKIVKILFDYFSNQSKLSVNDAFRILSSENGDNSLNEFGISGLEHITYKEDTKKGPVLHFVGALKGGVVWLDRNQNSTEGRTMLRVGITKDDMPRAFYYVPRLFNVHKEYLSDLFS